MKSEEGRQSMDFLRRQSFWVVVGGLLVVALVVYLVGVRRLASEDARLNRDLADADKQVKDLSASAEVPSEKWVEAAEQYEKELQGEYQEALKRIQERGVDLYKTLPNIPPADCVTQKDKEGKEYLLPTGAVFKTRYPEAVAELDKMLVDAHIVVRPPGVTLPQLTGAIPSDDAIIRLQKMYWLLRDVVDALAEGRVPVDEVFVLREEGSPEAGEFGPSGREGGRMGGRGGMGGTGEGGVAEVEETPTEETLDVTRLGGGERGSAGVASLQRFAGANVGVTTAMQELFFNNQRRLASWRRWTSANSPSSSRPSAICPG